MKIALDENKNKITPAKGVKGFCPSCGTPVISKCGLKNIHHFSHENKTIQCKNRGMTEWHYSWQEIVKIESRAVEVTIGKNRADIWHPKAYAIEIQSR